jgi:hypothetical protein
MGTGYSHQEAKNTAPAREVETEVGGTHLTGLAVHFPTMGSSVFVMGAIVGIIFLVRWFRRRAAKKRARRAAHGGGPSPFGYGGSRDGGFHDPRFSGKGGGFSMEMPALPNLYTDRISAAANRLSAADLLASMGAPAAAARRPTGVFTAAAQVHAPPAARGSDLDHLEINA